LGRSLAILTANAIEVHQAAGRRETFTLISNGTWQGDADTKLALTQDTSGYTLTYRDGTAEHYDAAGNLLSTTDQNGLVTSYGYDSQGRLTTITGPFGHTLTLGYLVKILTTVIDPAGKIISYDYNGSQLYDVRYPDGTAEKYYYENGNPDPYVLTGIAYATVTNGTLSNITRFSTYGYDPTTAKATLTQHAQTDNGSPQEKFTFTYNSDTQTTVTSAPGSNIAVSEVMSFSTNLGVKNLVTKTSSIDTKVLQQTFDLNNNLTCKKDEENRVTLYSYNSTNQRTSMTEGLSGTDCNACIANPANCNVGGVGRVTTYDYLSPTLDLPRFIRRPSVSYGQTFETELQYNDAGHPNLPTAITQRGYTPAGTAVSRTLGLGYNAAGQVNVIDGPRTDVNDVTTLDYYSCNTGGACGQLQRVTNALGHITTYNLYDANGRLLQMTDPNGLRTGYTYDPRGRVKTITQTTPAGSAATWQYSYTAWGDVSQVIDPVGVALNYQYDAAHYLRFIVDAAGNYLHYRYDLKGNRTGDDTYDPSGTLARTVSYTFDLRNHLASINLAGNITQVVYDAVGNLTSETDPNTHATTHTPDALNRLMQTIDRLGGITGYNYDLNDRLTRVTPPGKTGTQYAQDDLGNLLSETSPDRNTTLYTYDAAGNLKTVQTARGNVIGYSYDALNRLTFADAPITANDTTYVYDTCTNGIGRLCSVSNYWATVTYGYNPRGRVNSHQSVNYAYDLAGRLRTLTYPSGAIVTYGYNNVGQVSQVSLTRNGSTQVIASGMQYAAFGPVKALTYGNGKTLSQVWDTASRLSTQGIPGVLNLNYLQYDANGNLKQRNDAITSQTSNFTYDVLDRLDIASGGFGSRDYDHDANGNRTRLNDGINITAYGYASNTNRLTQAGATAVTVDADGNLTAQGSRTYTYNALNRLIRAYEGSTQIAGYSYNGLGQRITKQAGNAITSFAYGIEGQLLVETSGTTAREYLYLNGEPLAVMDQAVATGSPTVTVTTVPALLGSSLNVTWSGIASPTATDWVGVYVPGSADDAYLDWDYTNGSAAGTLAFPLYSYAVTAGGTYEMRLFANDGFTRLAKSAPFVVNPPGPVLAVTTSPAALGSNITVKWSGITSPTATDWVGVYVPGSADDAYLDWDYTNGSAAGTLAFPLYSYAVTAGGTYEMRLFANDSYTRLAKTPPFTVVAEASGSYTLYYVHNDHLGAPQVLTDEVGAVVWRATYDPFGQATVNEDPDGNGVVVKNNLGLAGMYADSETGLYYNWHRYYDPKTGRYISSDPIGLAGGLNTYVAVANNPLRYSDPTGLSTELLPDPQNMPETESEIRSSSGMLIDLLPGSGIPDAIETGGLTGAVLLAMEIPGLKGLKAAGKICQKAAAKSGVGEGTKVFRVWGDEAGAFGKSWTTVDPRTVPSYRSAAGLPNQNSGRFLSEGILQDTSGIRLKTADPLHGNAGGLSEVVIPNPQLQIQLRNVQGLNPHF
jgi:RHS repeat-associated protein